MYADYRCWKRGYGRLYLGTKEETPDTDKGLPSGLPRQRSTLPGKTPANELLLSA